MVEIVIDEERIAIAVIMPTVHSDFLKQRTVFPMGLKMCRKRYGACRLREANLRVQSWYMTDIWEGIYVSAGR